MSYTPLKTINGQSIEGTGNLTVTGSGAAWGSITGTLSSQTDLQGELDGKLDLDGGNANTDIDINTYSFNAKSLHCKGTGGAGHLGLKHQSGSITASTSESTLGADSSGNPVWKNDGNPIQNVMLENAAITGATKTKITYDSKGLVTAGADATTADIADSTNKRYVTDAQLTVIGNTSGTNTGDETTASIQTKLGTASASTSGYLTSTDWTTFNNKQAALTAGYGITGIPTPAVSLTKSQAFCTATTAISTATYADITGASITLAAGTWLLMATANVYAANTAFIAHIAITDGANTVIAEGSQGMPASGTASVNQWGNVSLSAIVSPAGSTTYKLRGARGNTTITGTYTVADGAGTGTSNNTTDNTDKGTVIMAVRIA